MDAKTAYNLHAGFYDARTHRFSDDIPLYMRLTVGCDRILEVGCGTGRILKKLIGRQKIITGVDISDKMLDISRRKFKTEIKNNRLVLLEHDFNRSPLNGKYDIGLITWHTFNYVQDDPSVFLNNISLSLRKKGLVVLDLFCPLTYNLPELHGLSITHNTRYKKIEYKIISKRSVTRGVEKMILAVEGGGKSSRIITYKRFFSKSDIFNLLTRAGYTNIKYIDNYDVDTMHKIKKNEKTDNDYICMAEKI